MGQALFPVKLSNPAAVLSQPPAGKGSGAVAARPASSKAGWEAGVVKTMGKVETSARGSSRRRIDMILFRGSEKGRCDLCLW